MTVDIELRTWLADERGWSEDWSNEFFEAGGLRLDAFTGAYTVDDAGYCIEQAKDLVDGVGDYFDPCRELAEGRGFGSYADYVRQADWQDVAIIGGAPYGFGF